MLREEFAQPQRDPASHYGPARAILDLAFDAFIEVGGAGVVMEWNSKAEETFGWARFEVLGRPLSEIILYPRHRLSFDEALSQFRATASGSTVSRPFETKALHRDGREFYIEVVALRVDGAECVPIIIRDITERWKRDKALRAGEKKAILDWLEDGYFEVIHDK
jgi:PAS domain S-box-containing protein